MSRRVWAGLLLALLVLSSGVSAADQSPKIPSKVVEKQVKKLTQKVHWYGSLDEAKEKARKANNLVLWLHALGDLDGAT
jgi:hypothetical protein